MPEPVPASTRPAAAFAAALDARLEGLLSNTEELHADLRKTRWVMLAGFAALAALRIAQLLRD